MKILFKPILAIFMLSILSAPAESQTIRMAEFMAHFSALQDGKIKVTDNNTTFNMSLSISRPSFFNKPVKLEAIIVFQGSQGEYNASGTITFTTANFVGSAGFSNPIENIPTTILGNNNDGLLKVKFRYYADGYDNEPDGWTAWQYHTQKSYQTIDVTPIPPYDPNAVPIYIYNSMTWGDHYLSPDSAAFNGSYYNEGIAFYGYRTNVPGSSPVYGYNSQQWADHYYGTGNSPTIGDGSYVNEGIAFYAFTTQVVGSSPVYVYNSQLYGDHYWGTGNSPTIGDGSYVNEGIVFYAYPAR